MATTLSEIQTAYRTMRPILARQWKVELYGNRLHFSNKSNKEEAYTIIENGNKFDYSNGGSIPTSATAAQVIDRFF